MFVARQKILKEKEQDFKPQEKVREKKGKDLSQKVENV